MKRSFWSTGCCLGKEGVDRTQQWGREGAVSDRRQHRTPEANSPYSTAFPQASLALRRGLK